MAETASRVETLYLAQPRGYCAGVVMAIGAVERFALELERDGEGDLAVYHAIVHNDTVVERLEAAHGVHFVEDLAELQGVEERAAASGRPFSNTVVFSAHWVSPLVRRAAAARGLPSTPKPRSTPARAITSS